jgi:hypothetical protein
MTIVCSWAIQLILPPRRVASAENGYEIGEANKEMSAEDVRPCGAAARISQPIETLIYL